MFRPAAFLRRILLETRARWRSNFPGAMREMEVACFVTLPTLPRGMFLCTCNCVDRIDFMGAGQNS
jgi:hypothetical protein